MVNYVRNSGFLIGCGFVERIYNIILYARKYIFRGTQTVDYDILTVRLRGALFKAVIDNT